MSGVLNSAGVIVSICLPLLCNAPLLPTWKKCWAFRRITTPTIEPLNIQSEQFIYLNYFMILILMLFGIYFVSVCYCIAMSAGVVFYYNNKITRAFNTPSTFHTHFPSPLKARHRKLPFHIFVASSRNFPRYLFQLKARFFVVFLMLRTNFMQRSFYSAREL